MDNQRVATELVKLAKQLTAKKDEKFIVKEKGSAKIVKVITKDKNGQNEVEWIVDDGKKNTSFGKDYYKAESFFKKLSKKTASKNPRIEKPVDKITDMINKIDDIMSDEISDIYYDAKRNDPELYKALKPMWDGLEQFQKSIEGVDKYLY
jgi:transcription termination factor NusB